MPPGCPPEGQAYGALSATEALPHSEVGKSIMGYAGLFESSNEPVLPWHGKERFLEALRSQIPCDAVAIGILGADQQQIDELLLLEGWSPQAIATWLAQGIHHWPAFRIARRRGGAILAAPVESGDQPPAPYAHGMLRLSSARPDNCRWWCLLQARDSQAFSRAEQLRAGWLLRTWQLGFDQPDEPEMSRLLIGHDRRLIYADPQCELRLEQARGAMEQLLELLFKVVEQRWPALTDGRTHDLVLPLLGRSYWVVVTRDRALDRQECAHWFVELWPMPVPDLPPVALVSDERVARALAYLHDCYQLSPSLAQIAEVAETSPFHFHRIFTKVTGISPKHYLQRKQLQVAKSLLRHTRQPISTVARRTGFASHGHFTSIFHRSVGVSPRQFRDRVLKTDHVKSPMT